MRGRGRLFFLAGLAALALLGTTLAVAHPAQVVQFGSPGAGVGQLASPGGIAADPGDGNVFVADTANDRISEFSAAGTFLRDFGQGQLAEPIGVAVSPLNGHVFALSLGDGRVQEFTATGGPVRSFGGYDFEDPAKFAGLNPANDIVVGPGGEVLVSNFGPNGVRRISVFSPTGTYQRQIVPRGPFSGAFSPGGVALDSTGRLYVVETSSDVEKVKVFDPDGVYLRSQTVAAYGAVQGIAVDPADDHLYLTIGKESDGSYELREYDPQGNQVEATPIFGLSPFTVSEPSYGLAFSPSAAFAGSAPGAFYVTDRGGGQVLALAQPEATAPSVEAVRASGVTSSSVDLVGTVNADGAGTTFRFEYGPTAAYGSVAPGMSIGSAYDPRRVGVHLQGLTPGATYHFSLVAENSEGVTHSADRVFVTTALGGTGVTVLPDGRAWELTSPLDKDFNDAGVVRAAALSGDAVAFASFNGLPGAESGTLESFSVSRRDGAGWTSTPISPPTTNVTSFLQLGEARLLSPELDGAIFDSTFDLSGGEAGSNRFKKYFLRTGPTFKLLTPFTPPIEPIYTAVGASRDFRHIVFEASTALTPDVPAPPDGQIQELYEWTNGSLRAVGVLPGESSPTPNGASGAASGVTGGLTVPNAVSADGSRIFFASVVEGASRLFVRIDGRRTVAVSASQAATPDPEGPKPARFVGASGDGSVVYFLSGEKLTDEAMAHAGPLSGDLYRFDVDSGTLEDLTVDTNPEDTLGAGVIGAVASDDGSTVYFNAVGNLAGAGKTEGNNLYRWNATDGLEFVAPLVPFYDAISVSNTRVSGDGKVFYFNSKGFLPGTEDTGEELNPVTEIFRYDAGARRIACVSCTPAGGVPTSGAQVTTSSLDTTIAERRVADRFFFETGDALVPQDVNGTIDVYEWRSGSVDLISSGTGEFDAKLGAASATGDDVFFTTRQRLVGRDVDDNIDVYDARVGGGLPEPVASVACVEAACRPSGPPAPGEPGGGSSGFHGPGNRAKTRRKACVPKKSRSRAGKHGQRVRCSKHKGKKGKRGRHRGDKRRGGQR